MSLGCLNIESGIRRVRVPDAVQRATLLRRTGTHAFCPRQRWAPALQHTTPQVRRAALRPGHETSELNRLARIWHRRRQAAIDRDRLSVDVGGVVAGEKQSHRRQPERRISSKIRHSLTKRRTTRSLSSGAHSRDPLAIAACAALLRGGKWLDSQLPSLHRAAFMQATCSSFRKPS
jgi:hypothetical protein